MGSPRVAVIMVSLPDGIQRNCHERLTRVSERMPVLEHGIHRELLSLLLDPVKRVTITELRSTRRSTVLVLDTTPLTAKRSKTMPPLKSISPISQSTQLVDLFTMVWSRTILL